MGPRPELMWYALHMLGRGTHDPPACGVRLLLFNGFELILFGFSMVFNGFIGQKCKVETFPDMNGS